MQLFVCCDRNNVQLEWGWGKLTLTAGEAVVAGATLGAGPTNHVGLTVALAPKHITVEAAGPVDVALALKHAVVVLTRQGEHRVTTVALLGRAASRRTQWHSGNSDTVTPGDTVVTVTPGDTVVTVTQYLAG